MVRRYRDWRLFRDNASTSLGLLSQTYTGGHIYICYFQLLPSSQKSSPCASNSSTPLPVSSRRRASIASNWSWKSFHRVSTIPCMSSNITCMSLYISPVTKSKDQPLESRSALGSPLGLMTHQRSTADRVSSMKTDRDASNVCRNPSNPGIAISSKYRRYFIWRVTSAAFGPSWRVMLIEIDGIIGGCVQPVN